jgi:hypothetical protein
LHARRRKEIERGLRDGLSYKEIGARLHLSERTIKWYMSDWFRERGLYGAGSAMRLLLEKHVCLCALLAVLLLPSALFANQYATNFPLTENPISEGGRWLNGLTNGIDWTDIVTVSGEAYGTNPGSGTGYNDSTAVVTGTWLPNQYASGVVHIGTITNSYYQEVELRLRTTISAHSITGYELDYSCHNDGTQYFAIARWNGPINNFTTLASTSGETALANGDEISGTIEGSTIKMYHNGVLLLTATDSTYTSGSPGIGTDLGGNGGGSTNAQFGFSSFQAHDDAPRGMALVIF